LLGLILIPLIYPSALPHHSTLWLIPVPPAPATQELPKPQPVHATMIHTELTDTGGVRAPSRIPTGIFRPDTQETLPNVNVAELGGPDALGSGPDHVFDGQRAHPVVRSEPTGPVRVPSTIAEARILLKTMPVYPVIAKEAGVQGTVVLQATISKAGTIENLRAVGGPPMLQQAALDAVRTWRYQPYLLNGQPIEVETTVNVAFILSR
jgi:protein TonB